MTPVEYWELRARQRDVELFFVEWQMMSQSHWKNDGDVLGLLRKRWEDAMEARADLVERLDLPAGALEWDDTTLSVRPKGEDVERKR